MGEINESEHLLAQIGELMTSATAWWDQERDK